MYSTAMSSFHLNGPHLGFDLQTQNLEPPNVVKIDVENENVSTYRNLKTPFRSIKTCLF